MLGYFNEILLNSEKEGGNPRLMRFMEAFRDCLDHCGVMDMEYIGQIHVAERKDRREA